MKKSLLFLVFFIFIICNNVYAMELSIEQKALMETMDAFYRKGSFFQYDGYKFSFDTTPELATNQNIVYTHCSNFAYNVYKNALGMDLLKNASLYTAHAYYDSTPDVVKIWNTSELETIKNTYQNNYVGFLSNELGSDLQVGDILTEMRASSAHTMLIYDIKYDSSNNVNSVTLLEAVPNYESASTKLSNNGLSYDVEGAIKKTDSQTKMNSFLFNNARNDYQFLSIIRPLAIKNANNSYQYTYANCDREKNANIYDMTKFHCSTINKEFNITDTANSRLKYSNIDIDKTITNENGIINGSDVELGEEITYNIKVTNNSNNSYNDLNIREKVSDYVDVVSNDVNLNGDTIRWKINVDANKSQTISYKVKVKDDLSYIGNDVISTGFVDNIKTPSIKNRISIGYSNNDKNKIKNAYNDLKAKTDKMGLDFVNAVFLKAFDTNLNLDKLEIDKLVENNIQSNSPYTLKINDSNEYSDLVFNDYYGGLRLLNTGAYYMKYWPENWLSTTWNGTDVDFRNNRQEYIYKEHFETGDVLVFSNRDDNVTNEDGVYAYVFIDNSFYGINKDNKNEFSTSETLSNGNSYLNTLFGKDYYVILRPSYRVNYFEKVVVPNTHYNFSKISIGVGLVLLLTGFAIFLKVFIKKRSF